MYMNYFLTSPLLSKPLLNWRDYLYLSEKERSDLDIAAINLAHAVGLRGAERIDIPLCLRTID
jgi:hypothetical protein